MTEMYGSTKLLDKRKMELFTIYFPQVTLHFHKQNSHSEGTRMNTVLITEEKYLAMHEAMTVLT
jgi:hypothetical protein